MITQRKETIQRKEAIRLHRGVDNIEGGRPTTSLPTICNNERSHVPSAGHPSVGIYIPTVYIDGGFSLEVLPCGMDPGGQPWPHHSSGKVDSWWAGNYTISWGILARLPAY